MKTIISVITKLAFLVDLTSNECKVSIIDEILFPKNTHNENGGQSKLY